MDDFNSGKKRDGVQHSTHRSEQGPGAGSSFKKLPITLSKKELCQILDCWTPGRKTPNYRRLVEKFFTPDVLLKIGITVEEFKSSNRFDRITTIKIIQVLEITEEAHEYAKNH